jgi:hypothetical protein
MVYPLVCTTGVHHSEQPGARVQVRGAPGHRLRSCRRRIAGKIIPRFKASSPELNCRENK